MKVPGRILAAAFMGCLAAAMSAEQPPLNIPPGGKPAVEATLALQAAREAALRARPQAESSAQPKGGAGQASALRPAAPQAAPQAAPKTAAPQTASPMAGVPAPQSGSKTQAPGGAGPGKPSPTASQAGRPSQAALAIAESRAERGAAAVSRLGKGGSDGPGDAPADYLDLIRAEVAVFPDELVAAFALASLPDALPFNSPDLEEGMLEYEWSCAIDLQGDGKDDFMLSLSAFKSPGAEALEGSLLESCMAALWKMSASGADMAEAEVRAEIRGASILLILPESAAFPLRLITPKTRFTLGAYGDRGGGAALDSLRL